MEEPSDYSSSSEDDEYSDPLEVAAESVISKFILSAKVTYLIGT